MADLNYKPLTQDDIDVLANARIVRDFVTGNPCMHPDTSHCTESEGYGSITCGDCGLRVCGGCLALR